MKISIEEPTDLNNDLKSYQKLQFNLDLLFFFSLFFFCNGSFSYCIRHKRNV